MRWTRTALAIAISLSAAAQVARAQVTVNYSTTGAFSGLCTGLTCVLGGMTINYLPLTSNTIQLDANNGFSSFLSFGEFDVSGSTSGQQSFAGVTFDLAITQNLPTPGGTQVITGQLIGGIDGTSSNLSWSPLPIAWNVASGASSVINYTASGRVDLQAPTSNHGVTSIQGGLFTTVVPEPSTYLLVAGGLAGVLVAARRKRSV